MAGGRGLARRDAHGTPPRNVCGTARNKHWLAIRMRAIRHVWQGSIHSSAGSDILRRGVPHLLLGPGQIVEPRRASQRAVEFLRRGVRYHCCDRRGDRFEQALSLENPRPHAHWDWDDKDEAAEA